MSMLEEHPHLIRLKQVLYAPQRLYLITGGLLPSRQTCSFTDPYTSFLPHLLMHYADMSNDLPPPCWVSRCCTFGSLVLSSMLGLALMT